MNLFKFKLLVSVHVPKLDFISDNIKANFTLNEPLKVNQNDARLICLLTCYFNYDWRHLIKH